MIDNECAIKEHWQRENSCFRHSGELKLILIKFDLLLSSMWHLYNKLLNMWKVILY